MSSWSKWWSEHDLLKGICPHKRIKLNQEHLKQNQQSSIVNKNRSMSPNKNYKVHSKSTFRNLARKRPSHLRRVNKDRWMHSNKYSDDVWQVSQAPVTSNIWMLHNKVLWTTYTQRTTKSRPDTIWKLSAMLLERLQKQAKTCLLQLFSKQSELPQQYNYDSYSFMSSFTNRQVQGRGQKLMCNTR